MKNRLIALSVALAAVVVMVAVVAGPAFAGHISGSVGHAKKGKAYAKAAGSRSTFCQPL